MCYKLYFETGISQSVSADFAAIKKQHATTQRMVNSASASSPPDRLKSTLKYGLNQSGRRLVGLGLKPSKLAIPGSNPGDRTKQGFRLINVGKSLSQVLYCGTDKLRNDKNEIFNHCSAASGFGMFGTCTCKSLSSGKSG